MSKGNTTTIGFDNEESCQSRNTFNTRKKYQLGLMIVLLAANCLLRVRMMRKKKDARDVLA